MNVPRSADSDPEVLTSSLHGLCSELCLAETQSAVEIVSLFLIFACQREISLFLP